MSIKRAIKKKMSKLSNLEFFRMAAANGHAGSEESRFTPAFNGCGENGDQADSSHPESFISAVAIAPTV